jgi:Family of unknown function (DUF5856)
MESIEILQKFFEARDTIHLLHLHTKCFSEHKALGEFYDEWLDLADSFIEKYQGRFNIRIEGSINISANTTIVSDIYIRSLYDFLLQIEVTIAGNADLLNIVADMKGLVNETLYLLTLK